MTAFTITADNFRLDDCSSITGVTSRGGGPGASSESPLAYEGTLAWNRKITSATGAGFQYDPVSDAKAAVNMTAANRRTLMVKCVVSDALGLQSTEGVVLYLLTSAFVLSGSSAVKNRLKSYPLRTFHIIVPVDPNIVAYRDPFKSSGNPNFASTDLFGIEAAFANPTAKSENVGLDALDIGDGLIATGGTSPDAPGNWSNFAAFDEGVLTNRFGYASFIAGGTKQEFFGKIRVGNGSSAVRFNGTGNFIRPDGLYAAGWAEDIFDVSVAGTVITDTSIGESLGTTAGVDTRADVRFVGTTVPTTISHVRRNYRNYTMTSAITLNGADIDIVSLTQGSGTIQNSVIRTNASSGGATLADPVPAKLSDISWIQGANGAGHAMVFGPSFAGTTVTLTRQSFSGYGANGSNSAAIYNNSGGAINFAIVDGGTPTIRNGAGATSTSSNSKTLTFTNIPNGLEGRVRVGSISKYLVPSITGNTFQYSYDAADAGKVVTITIGGVANDGKAYVRFKDDFVLTTNNQSQQLNFDLDPSYSPG